MDSSMVMVGWVKRYERATWNTFPSWTENAGRGVVGVDKGWGIER